MLIIGYSLQIQTSARLGIVTDFGFSNTFERKNEAIERYISLGSEMFFFLPSSMLAKSKCYTSVEKVFNQKWFNENYFVFCYIFSCIQFGIWNGFSSRIFSVILKLISQSVHCKMIHLSMDITLPIYMWHELAFC